MSSPEQPAAVPARRRSRRRRRSSVVAAATLLCAVLGGCVAPAFDSGAFTRNAIEALDAATSETRTARLAVLARLRDRVTQPYADTVVTASEKALGPIQDSFGTVDAPSTTDDALRDDVTTLLGDAADAVTSARIAVRRHDEAAMQDSVAELGSVSDRLERKSDSLS